MRVCMCVRVLGLVSGPHQSRSISSFIHHVHCSGTSQLLKQLPALPWPHSVGVLYACVCVCVYARVCVCVCVHTCVWLNRSYFFPILVFLNSVTSLYTFLCVCMCVQVKWSGSLVEYSLEGEFPEMLFTISREGVIFLNAPLDRETQDQVGPPTPLVCHT